MGKQQTENELLTGDGGPEEGTYATTYAEVRQGYPIFGRIVGHSDDLEEVEVNIPYNHRLKWQSLCLEKDIKPGIYTLHTGQDGEIKLTFRVNSLESGSELTENNVPEPAATPTAGNDRLQERCKYLEGQLHDVDREKKILQDEFKSKERELLDEIVQLKRALSEDKTAILLTHQKELTEVKDSYRRDIERLKEAHQRDIKEFEKQINEFDKQVYKLEIEEKFGGRDNITKLLDALKDYAPMAISGLMQLNQSGQQDHASRQPVHPDPTQAEGSLSEAERIAMGLNGQTAHGHEQPADQPPAANLPQKPEEPGKTGEGAAPTAFGGHPAGSGETKQKPDTLKDYMTGQKKNGQRGQTMEI